MSPQQPAPETPTELSARAEAHANRREFQQAITLYERVLENLPNDPYTLVQLSYMHSLSGRYRQARDFALQANATQTVDPKVIGELIPRLRTFNEIPALLDCIERLLPVSGIPIPLLITIAAQLSYLNLPERAIDFLNEARRGDPDYPPTLLARTQVLIYLGRFHEAEVDVARALQRAPDLAQGHGLQAMLRKQTKNSHHLRAIRAQMVRPGRSAGDMAVLAFALHKELDDLGDHDAAWEALMLGCRAKRSTLNYAAGDSTALMQALTDFTPPAPIAAMATGKRATPVFIVGMHRSGTTLLEQLLDGGSQIRGIGEMYDFTSAMRNATDHHCRGVIDLSLVQRAGQADLKAGGERYLQGLQWRLGDEPFFTDKLPSNFLNIGFIAEALPQAKILHMVRDPVETCFSNLRELFSDANPYSYDLTELADYFNGYRRLMAHWHAKYPGRILDVDYAQLTRDPEAQLRRVAEFCGLPFEPAMLDLQSRKRGIVTASAVQVRSGIKVQEQPKWKPYEKFLLPLLDQLVGD